MALNMHNTVKNLNLIFMQVYLFVHDDEIVRFFIDFIYKYGT